MDKTIFKYCEIVKDNTSNRGNIVELPDNLNNNMLDYYGKEVVNGFHSVFMHSSDILEYVKSTGSIRGYSGSVFSECLYFDMDNSSVDEAKIDTIEVVDRLKTISNNIRIYFSGNKGFHIICYCPELEDFIDELNFNDVIKQVCSKVAENIKSFDTVIYDKTRIIRTPNSKHGETGLYKIELTYEELKTLSVEDIQELAKKQRRLDSVKYSTEKNQDITNLIKDAVNNKTTTKSRSLFDASELLNGMINGFESGKRNNAFASIAGMLHSRNIDDNFIKAVLLNVNANNETPLSENEIDSIINSISRYPVKEEYVEPTSKDILTIRDAGLNWLNNVEKSGDFSLGDRYSHINAVMGVTLLGDLISVVSNSGVGKSTLTLDFGNSYAQLKNKYNLFVSLEMASHACFFRAATISYNPDENGEVDSKEVATNLVKNIELRNEIYEQWNRTLFVDKGSIPLNLIEDYANKANDLYNGQLGSVVIDYSQYIDGASDIEKALYIARETKGIIKRLNVIGFIAMQCNKSMPNSFTEIEDSHVEGVKAAKQACDYMLAFWKSKKDNKRLHGKFLKTRWGRDDLRFDLIRNGLKYHTVDEQKESSGLEL